MSDRIDTRPPILDSAGVTVSGMGIVTPLGCSIEELAHHCEDGGEAVAAPNALRISEIPVGAMPADKRARIGRLDRLCRVFLSASYSAVDAARLEMAPAQAGRVGLSFGTGFGCLLTNAEYHQKIVESGPAAASPRLFAYTVSSAAAGEVSIALGITGPNVTAHMGFAAGLGAVGYGVDLIQMGKADVVLAGGADVIGPPLLDGLRDMGLLKTREQSRPFIDAVPGVWPSEGAGVLVLEREDRARARGARVWAHIAGYAAGFEPTLTGRTRESTGIVASMRRALDLSGCAASDIDLVMSSAHGTPIDRIEQRAMEQVFGAPGPRVRAPKAVLGETFAASGVLAIALAAGAHRLPSSSGAQREPLVVMVNALCYSGNIVSLILRCE
ncbi:MAG TPA: beta-ketoacyl synthase N-terminal-like domain-containing protein [Candidatus Kryptonia bacterium]|nr:beta-ketoacyl synthase N-terminal-like domain-containing protein [Candidatus Kryptonia bacterium]